jgi:hypothetical protein
MCTDQALRSKPQTLFKSTSAKKLESAKSAPMFGDIPKDKSAVVEDTTGAI